MQNHMDAQRVCRRVHKIWCFFGGGQNQLCLDVIDIGSALVRFSSLLKHTCHFLPIYLATTIVTMYMYTVQCTLPFRIPFYPFLNAYRALSEILNLKKKFLYIPWKISLSLPRFYSLTFFCLLLLLSTFYILHVKSIKSTMLTRWEMNGAQKKSYM